MHNNLLKLWLDSTFLTKNNQSYIDQIYKKFLKNSTLVNSSWRSIFQKWHTSGDCSENNQFSQDLKLSDISSKLYENTDNVNTLTNQTDITHDIHVLELKILKLIYNFRVYGNQYAILDPLNLSINEIKNSFLTLEYYGFENYNLQQSFNTNLLGLNKGYMTLNNIYSFLKKSYCKTIGIEYMHILNTEQIFWIQNYFESQIDTYNFLKKEEQKQFLTEIIAAESLEIYLGKKFPGVKRFSLEGGDVLIPMLKEIIRHSVSYHNIQEIFLGMAHRGRLNVLINILGKKPQHLFDEFYDNKHKNLNISGDVKYHQGLHSNITINERIIQLHLLSNPSHLEIITPIVMGSVRSRIDQLYYNKKVQKKEFNFKSYTHGVLSIVIHGDAAISGQGIVQESFNMSHTRAYSIGGTLHIIINNQIGFTTSDIRDIRSTLYCTDIAKMIQAPIFHVNADDVNAVIFITRFALNFLNKFKRDIIIDLVCYRRHGHNETDDPSVTQPIMYHKICNHPTVVDIYTDILIKNKIVDINEIHEMKRLYHFKLENEHCLLTDWKPVHTKSVFCINHPNDRSNYINIKKIDEQYLLKLACVINNIPSNIIMHERVKKIYNNRLDMASSKQLFDWGAAETLSYATLLDQGYTIRLSGEDVARGTFFHRHAVIYDQNSNMKYIPLMHIRKEQGNFFIWDSVLSEESTLAFEYGYSTIAPNNTLVIWEAQFGDFANGAQIVIDQFITSSEQKWNQTCGLVMLLPHGYEGQGPEHSSCRIERYLQLCAEHNIRICVPSNPAQIYHILRQQASNNIVKPLIIVSPKSLLRHPMAISSIKDLVCGSFQTVINETYDKCNNCNVNKIIICTGKIYYDLVSQRNKIQTYNTVIIRIEQLYPFPELDINKILNSYTQVKHFIWCQEEPKNQGAWYYIQRCFYEYAPHITLNYVGRNESASPAVGSFSIHQQQQKTIIDNALA